MVEPPYSRRPSEHSEFPGSLLEFEKQRAKRRTHQAACISSERQTGIKKYFHSPFDVYKGFACPSGTPEVERFRIVVFSSSANENVSRPISPQLGPSSHLAVYQNVYYTALAYFATRLSLSSPRSG